jgi:hypothetical protein
MKPYNDYIQIIVNNDSEQSNGASHAALLKFSSLLKWVGTHQYVMKPLR